MSCLLFATQPKKDRKMTKIQRLLMTNPLEYIRKHPKLAKQLIGLTLPQLEQLIKQAIALDEQRKKAAEDHKIRVNKKGAGRAKNLSEDAEICLTIFYLRQMPIFEVLGIIFDVSRTTANDIFHYWLSILRDLLPCSLLEEWQNSIKMMNLCNNY